MAILILGLIVFLGLHSVRIFADSWRTRQIERLGAGKWKGIYSLLSLVGFVLIIVGFGQARVSTPMIWTPPLWTWHLTGTINLVAFVLFVAAYVPRNGIKIKLKDPMILGVKTWAFAHLLSNGSLAGMALFGSFLVWAILDFKSCRQRRVSPAAPPPISLIMTAVTVLVGLVAWGVFAMHLHQVLIGIRPFG